MEAVVDQLEVAVAEAAWGEPVEASVWCRGVAPFGVAIPPEDM